MSFAVVLLLKYAYCVMTNFVCINYWNVEIWTKLNIQIETWSDFDHFIDTYCACWMCVARAPRFNRNSTQFLCITDDLDPNLFTTLSTHEQNLRDKWEITQGTNEEMSMWLFIRFYISLVYCAIQRRHPNSEVNRNSIIKC